MRYRSSPSLTMGPVLFLIILNLIFFIATLISQDLIFILGLKPAFFLQQPWTILTSMFVHAGFFHLFGNMLTLFFFGTFLSRMVGDGRFLLLYFGGGILGGIMFILLSQPFNWAVGASGAVFALGGALTVMMPKLKVFIIPIPVPVPLWVAVFGGFVILSFLSFVAWQAHLGGLIFGLIAGYIFKRNGRYYINY